MARTIRLAKPADAAAIAALYAPYVQETAITFEAEPPSAETFRQRMAAVLEHAPWLVAEDGALLLGYAYATRFRDRAAYRWTMEVAIYVAQDNRKEGLGKALYARLFEALGVQGYRTLIAGVTLPNPASIALHEGFGFEAIGTFPRVGYKFGAWHDVGFWSKALLPAIPEPKEPLSLARALEQEGFRALLGVESGRLP